jgi:transcriptional regulator GlxA family with amidase domain
LREGETLHASGGGILEARAARGFRGTHRGRAQNRHRAHHPVVRQIVKEAEQYLKENGDRAVHVSELCEKIKIRRRTLFRAFDDAVGRAPIDFLRAKRLSMAHLKLCEAEVGGASVAEIAGELGFLELGRFAQQYRNLFGSAPAKPSDGPRVLAAAARREKKAGPTGRFGTIRITGGPIGFSLMVYPSARGHR